MANHQLNETLFGLFYDVFKRTGIPLGMDQLDALRGVTDKITRALQEEIKDGMKKVAAITISEMKALEERLSGQKNIKETGNS